MTPYIERTYMGGPQKFYRFENGWGASVVQHVGSYGGGAGLWEMATIRWTGEKYDLVESSLFGDVLGWLAWAEVEDWLQKISELEAP